jgi:hypothetical protein
MNVEDRRRYRGEFAAIAAVLIISVGLVCVNSWVVIHFALTLCHLTSDNLGRAHRHKLFRRQDKSYPHLQDRSPCFPPYLLDGLVRGRILRKWALVNEISLRKKIKYSQEGVHVDTKCELNRWPKTFGNFTRRQSASALASFAS